MELKKYIKRMFKPSVKKRAKAMKKAKKARSRALVEGQKQALEELQDKLAYKFNDTAILHEALTHPGSVGISKKVKSNQRLEFLGDSILQSVITDTVFKRFEEYDEGTLTKIRIVLTQGSFLTDLSNDLNIPKYLILPKGSEYLRESASAAEDAFEAVIGAIYLDSDFNTARKTVLGWYRRKLEDLPDLVQQQNPKGALQEAAAKLGEKVEYHLLGQSGPDHQKVFEVEVCVGGVRYASASESSKKSAESKAARAALKEYSKVVAAKQLLDTAKEDDEAKTNKSQPSEIEATSANSTSQTQTETSIKVGVSAKADTKNKNLVSSKAQTKSDLKVESVEMPKKSGATKTPKRPIE